MQASKRSQTIQEYYFSSKLKEIARMRSQGIDVINLGIGSPDLAPDIEVRTSISKAVSHDESFTYQPYKGIPDLAKVMLDWYARIYQVDLLPSTQIIPLMGSKEGIGFMALAYLDPGDEALVPDPGYPTYAAAVKIAGGTPVNYALSAETAWHPNLDQLHELVTNRTRMIFVNYPHMPTGQHADRSRLQELLRFCAEHDLLLCNDNPYSHTLSEDPFSIFQLEGSQTHAIELNSLSKSHSMAGARVGMMTGQPNLLDPVFKVQSSFSSGMFYPIQQGAITALKQGEEAFHARNAIYRARRKMIWELMDRIGCAYSRDAGGLFVWARVPNTYLNGQELSDQLLRSAHVFLTPGIVFGKRGESYIRASLCQPKQVIHEAINRIHTYQSTKS